ncbi:FAR1-related sequence 5-like protein [Tanacetum coccineum]
MDPSHSSALSSVSQNSVSSDVVDESCVPSGSSLNALTEEIVAYEKESDETHAVKIKGNVYNSVDDCVVAYMKYVAEAGFVVSSCQKRLRNGDVKQKYLVCNRKGCSEGIHVDTLDLENSDKQKRNSNLYITRCKARAVFNLDPRTRKFVLNVFDTIHNHELEREEFKEFGDVVSFDATFKTNKYKMVIVPFTTIDNHKKCVMVATGLLKNESTKSYIWLLKAFIKAFRKAPSIVVTDQDGAMRNAIEDEFVGSKHRLCMWHITQKLPAKICAKIYDEIDFKEKLNKIVWNMYIGPKKFEYIWGKLMEEFKLGNHKWLTKMFIIRSTWIPAYFIGSPLCGLMRTTSRSKSENFLFSHFTNFGSTLMNFMNCFETAMEKQRHVQERMDHKTIDTVPKLKTFLKIERHASNVYTRSLFELVQKEIFVGLWHFQIDSKSLVEGSEVLRNNANVEMIPQQYILRRWTKNLIPAALRNKRNRYDEPRLGAFVEADCPNPPSKNKTDNLEQLVGVPKPPAIDVNNPTIGSTKGRKKLHIKGGKEKAIKKSLKGRNSCSLCGGTDHNKRTCPGRFEVQDEVVVQKEVCQEEVVQEKVDLAEDEEELVEEDEDLIHE